MFGLWYNILFGFLIIVFTYFYTAITVPTNKMSDDLKRSGGFVPGIRPGSETADFLDKIMSLITFPGSLFLAAVSVFPAIVVQIMGMQQGWALFLAGNDYFNYGRCSNRYNTANKRIFVKITTWFNETAKKEN